ncbi:MAG: restriction endonuclease subunit S [Phycisphaerae bacterium]
MPFTEAVVVNPPVPLEKGKVYPFVDMASVNPAARSVQESEHREFRGGGSRFMPGDTLMARITPCLENGKIARFRPTDAASAGFGSTEFIVIRGRDGLTDNDFAYYLTKWDEFRQFAVSQMAGTSGRQRVPAESPAHFTVAVPPLPIQRRIAAVLGALDDKIELNRRMNRTLEAMAAAIFKSWFIDFDPVHAKAEGRDTNLPAEIADLFPDSFEDSPIGPIPKGWTVSKLGDLIELAYGKSLRAQDRRPGPVAVYGSNGPVGWHDTVLVPGPGIVVGRKGNPGIVTWSPAEFFPMIRPSMSWPPVPFVVFISYFMP